MKKVIKELIPYVIIIIVVVLIRTFVITPVRVSGTSMYPTLDDGEVLLLKKYDKKFKRFDIVVFDYEDGNERDDLIKRVIGLPGEAVEYKDSKLYIDGKEVYEEAIAVETKDFSINELGYSVIPEGKYLLIGDNRGNSLDSRIIGLIDEDKIKGKTDFLIFPFNKFGKIK